MDQFPAKLANKRSNVLKALRRKQSDVREAREAAAATGEVAPVEEGPATEVVPAETAPAPEAAKTTQEAAPAAVTEADTKPAVKSAPIPGADGPVPGETFEQKIERLKRVVAGARERAIREGKREA